MDKEEQTVTPEVSVIIPMYNEAEGIVENIQKTQQVLQENSLHYELIIVDDGSTDNSHTLVQNAFSKYENIQIHRHKRNEGTSEALRTGLRNSKGVWVTHLDADLQYRPEEIIRFYTRAKESHAPFIWGDSDKGVYSPFRLLLAKGKNILAGILFNIPVPVDLSSIKLIKRSALSNFQYSKQKQIVGLELFLHAVNNNHTIIPVPVRVYPRTQGSSSFKVRWIFETIGNTLALYRTKKHEE